MIILQLSRTVKQKIINKYHKEKGKFFKKLVTQSKMEIPTKNNFLMLKKTKLQFHYSFSLYYPSTVQDCTEIEKPNV